MSEKITDEATVGVDPVHAGIAEWQKVKREHGEAMERAAKAEAQEAYYRGQNDLLLKQKIEDDARIHGLQQKYDEMRIMLEALAAAMVAAIKKQADGGFTLPTNGNGRRNAEELRALMVGELEADIGTITEDARGKVAIPGRPVRPPAAPGQ